MLSISSGKWQTLYVIVWSRDLNNKFTIDNYGIVNKSKVKKPIIMFLQTLFVSNKFWEVRVFFKVRRDHRSWCYVSISISKGCLTFEHHRQLELYHERWKKSTFFIKITVFNSNFCKMSTFLLKIMEKIVILLKWRVQIRINSLVVFLYMSVRYVAKQ